MFPYKIRFLQQLLPREYRRQLDYAQHVRLELRNDSRCLYRILILDECVFHTIGVVNKHNAEVWSQKSASTVVQVPQVLQKIVLWCSMQKTKIAGRHFSSKPAVAGDNYKKCFFTMLCPGY